MRSLDPGQGLFFWQSSWYYQVRSHFVNPIWRPPTRCQKSIRWLRSTLFLLPAAFHQFRLLHPRTEIKQDALLMLFLTSKFNSNMRKLSYQPYLPKFLICQNKDKKQKIFLRCIMCLRLCIKTNQKPLAKIKFVDQNCSKSSEIKKKTSFF